MIKNWNWFKRRWPDLALLIWAAGFFGHIFGFVSIELAIPMILPAYAYMAYIMFKRQ